MLACVHNCVYSNVYTYYFQIISLIHRNIHFIWIGRTITKVILRCFWFRLRSFAAFCFVSIVGWASQVSSGLLPISWWNSHGDASERLESTSTSGVIKHSWLGKSAIYRWCSRENHHVQRIPNATFDDRRIHLRCSWHRYRFLGFTIFQSRFYGSHAWEWGEYCPTIFVNVTMSQNPGARVAPR